MEQTGSQLIGFGVEVILGDRVFPLVNSFHNIEHTLSITIAAWYVVSDRCVCLRYFNKTHLRITLLLLMVIVSNILLALHHSYLFIVVVCNGSTVNDNNNNKLLSLLFFSSLKNKTSDGVVWVIIARPIDLTHG